MSGMVFFGWVAFAVVVGVAANARGRSWIGWFLIALVLSPLLALILVLVMKPVVSQETATTVNAEAGQSKKDDLYDDTPDLQSGRYQLFLTKKYAIERNTTLEKYVIGDSLFPTLETALMHADDLERDAIRSAKNERLRYAYLIKECRIGENAFSSGIRAGDFLATYNGYPITSDQDILDAMSKLIAPTANLVIYRDGKPKTFTIPVGKMGIDGSIEKIDDNLYAIRLKDLAIT